MKRYLHHFSALSNRRSVVRLLAFLLSFHLCFTLYAQLSGPTKPWNTNPFAGKEFIENKGQFTTGDDRTKNTILYGADFEGVQIYFTSKGLTYEHSQPKSKNREEEEKEERENEKNKISEREREEREREEQEKADLSVSLVQMEWQNSNRNVKVIAEEPLTDYYSYPDKSRKHSIRARIFKKIIYKDLYPGVDVEYVFHEKEGIKYSLVIHPGADVSKIQMKYTGTNKIINDEKGNVHFKTDYGDIIEHAPLTFYGQSINESEKNLISSSFNINSTVISFQLAGYDKSKTIVIDPWVTNPGFATLNKAFDIGTDAAGNIYVCGSSNPFKIKKYNSAGVAQWTYNTVGLTNLYGDFAVDASGNSYFSTNNQGIIKVDATGSLVYSANSYPFVFSEPWTLYFNNSLNSLIMTGGMGQESITNVSPASGAASGATAITGGLGSGTAGSEIKSITRSPCGNYYSLSSSPPSSTSPGTVRGMTPGFSQIFGVSSGYTTFGYYCALYKGSLCGTNAIAASNFNIYTFEGSTLIKRDITNGAFVSSVAVFGAVALRNSGITVDSCENIYVGTQSGVTVYDKNLNYITSVATTGAVYDVRININKELIACGDGFVQSFGVVLPPCSPPMLNITINPTSTNCGSNNGSATANATNGLAPYIYTWSNGQTTQTATGLTAGSYTVTITDATCISTSKTILINNSNGPAISFSQTNVNCATSGIASALVTGGTSPYTYSWSNGSTSQTISNLSAGTYTVTSTDNTGCFSTNTVTILNNGGMTGSSTLINNVICFGGNSGKVNATASGGTGSLSYSWSDGETGATATALVAGIYTVTIKDANGCTVTATGLLTEPAALIDNITTFSDVSCNGGADGSITVAPLGGNSPYTYNWSNGQTSATATNLSASPYTLTVTDAKGCTAKAIYNVAQPPPLSIDNITITNTDCGQPNSGAISTSVSGGTPGGASLDYNYVWSNGSTTSGNINNIPAGTYTLTVTDVNGCSISTTATVGTGPHPGIIATFTPNLTTVCLGSKVKFKNTGSSGTGYSHVWYVMTITQSVLAFGFTDSLTYTFNTAGSFIIWQKVTNSPCSETIKDTITVVTCANPIVTAGTATVCAGSCAAVTSNGSGGTTPYTYLWSTGATTQNINPCPLSTTTYTLTITDAGGNTATTTALVNVNTAVNVTTTSTDIICNGGTDGSALATGSNGTAPYSYLWSNSQNTQTATGLTQNTYTVTITDNKGCTSTSTAIITQPAAIVTTASQNAAASCGNNDGVAITTTATGGTGSYTYNWSNGATGLTASSLSAGTYTVTIADGNGCTETAAAIINNSPAPTISNITHTDLLCNAASTGVVSVAATGTGTLTYTWTNGSSGVTAANLNAGTYFVTVTDGNGCNAISSVTVTEPAAISGLTITTTNATCGSNNGTAALAMPMGGTGSYTYSWSSGGTGLSVNSLPVGTYTVMVTDANGCTATSAVAIVNSGGPAINSVTVANPLCPGGTGTAVASASGGSGTLTYSWDSGGTTSTETNLVNGTYTVTVSDANSCMTTSTAMISSPTPITLSASQNAAATCGNANGIAVSSIASGGTGSFTYSWSNGATGLTATNLASGSYIVTATDANGCWNSDTVIINSTSGPVINSVTGANPLCAGGSGIAVATASGGTGTLSYTWSTTSTGQTENNLASGTYSVTVNDINNCQNVSTVTITVPPAINITAAQNTAASCGGNNGVAVATASGGSGLLIYSWSNGATGQTVTGLAAASYIVTITDGNACTNTQAVLINNSPAPSINGLSITNILCNGNKTGSATISASGTGTLSYSWSTGSTATSINNQNAGTYTITVTDGNGCNALSSVTITEPPAILSSLSSTTASCGTDNGSATIVTLSGGSGTLSHTWSTGSTNSTISNLLAGTYTLSITDANGCTQTNTVSVNNSGGPTINSVNTINPLCSAGSGTASIIASGGSGTLTYSWSSGSTSNSTSGLVAGIYTVTVMDANSCLNVSTVTISEPPAILPIASQTKAAACGQSNGTASATATGGSGSLVYVWSNGSTTSTATGLSAAIYTVTVTDANNCSKTTTVSIINSNGPVALTSLASGISCFGGTGSVAVTVTNGTAPYTYNWSNGANAVTSSLTNAIALLPAKTYIVTITDASNCITTDSIVLTQPAILTVTATSTPQSCGETNGITSAVAGGGKANYSYSWSNAQVTDTIKNLSAGIYTVTATDANGCTATATTAITSVAAGTLNIEPVTKTIVEGNSVSIIVSGGSVYTWTPAANLSCTQCANPVASPVTSTIYTVTTTDMNGCTITGLLSITVKPACVGDDQDVFIPNIFSPNGDGKNDVLNIEGNGLTNIYWAIYDRWGNLLFETYDQSQGWDGTLKGNPMETGTYVYYLKATCIKTNSEIKLKGNVSIVK